MNKKNFPTYWTNGVLEELSDLLIEILKARDPYAETHARGVSRYSSILASSIEMKEYEIEILNIAASLHDIGKINMPDFVLNKAGQLTQSERDTMKQHPRFGYQLLLPLRMSPRIVEAIYYHHESFDGTGYPDGLEGKKIPLYARIIKIADYFDALINSRYYRAKVVYSPIEALDIIKSNAREFDPDLLTAFIQMQSHKEGE